MRLSALSLKLIAIAAMVVDHVAFTFVPYGTPLWTVMDAVGKLTGPIMFYMAVEGFHHTRSIRRYLARLAGFAGVVGMRMAEYASPETVQRLEAMEDEWDTAVGTALAGNEAVANAETYVNYNFSWPERTLVPQALAELGDGASANVTLAGEYEDVQAFLAAAQPVVQAVKGCGVDMPSIHLAASGPNGTQYLLDICGAFAHQRAVTDLASQVTVQQWVEGAGCYMDVQEAAQWTAENDAAAREEEMARREEELAAWEERLAQQQAEQEQRESELAAQQEELAAWEEELAMASAPAA